MSSAVGRDAHLGATKERHVAVLLYHHVGPVADPACRGLTVESGRFSRQMTALSAMGFSTIHPGDWAAHLRGERDLPAWPVIITFDDAYADLTTHAFPALLRHHFSATVFVPTALIGGTIECSPHKPDAVIPVMTASGISEWAERGIEFGAHSRTHADLTRISAGDALEEIRGSRDDLAALLGRDVRTFAYPYGRWNAAVREMVSQLFETAFTIEEGLNDAGQPPSSLRRTMVQHGDSVVDVCLRARYGASALQRVRNAVRGAGASGPARA